MPIVHARGQEALPACGQVGQPPQRMAVDTNATASEKRDAIKAALYQEALEDESAVEELARMLERADQAANP